MIFQFQIEGDLALFSDPLTRICGEKQSYPIPTAEALEGIAKSIYWKPTIMYKIKRVRIMNEVDYLGKTIRMPTYASAKGVDRQDLYEFLYLRNVKYQVEVEMLWNYNHPECARDRIPGKHDAVFRRSLDKGGRYDVYLGTRECQAIVKPVIFGAGKSFYDGVDAEFGYLYHGLTYPDERARTTDPLELVITHWRPRMVNGVIDYSDSSTFSTRVVQEMPQKTFIMAEEEEGNCADNDLLG